MTTLATSWDKINQHNQLSTREKDRVVELFNNTEWNYVVWIPEWLGDKKHDLEPLGQYYRLFVGEIEDHSQKAWRLWQPHRNNSVREPNDYLPKSQVVVFERARGVTLERPQAGINTYTDGGTDE